MALGHLLLVCSGRGQCKPRIAVSVVNAMMVVVQVVEVPALGCSVMHVSDPALSHCSQLHLLDQSVLLQLYALLP